MSSESKYDQYNSHGYSVDLDSERARIVSLRLYGRTIPIYSSSQAIIEICRHFYNMSPATYMETIWEANTSRKFLGCFNKTGHLMDRPVRIGKDLYLETLNSNNWAIDFIDFHFQCFLKKQPEEKRATPETDMASRQTVVERSYDKRSDYDPRNDNMQASPVDGSTVKSQKKEPQAEDLRRRLNWHYTNQRNKTMTWFRNMLRPKEAALREVSNLPVVSPLTSIEETPVAIRQELPCCEDNDMTAINIDENTNQNPNSRPSVQKYSEKKIPEKHENTQIERPTKAYRYREVHKLKPYTDRELEGFLHGIRSDADATVSTSERLDIHLDIEPTGVVTTSEPFINETTLIRQLYTIKAKAVLESLQVLIDKTNQSVGKRKSAAIKASEKTSTASQSNSNNIITRLYKWQKEALDVWENKEGRRGIVEAATGSGKTLLALACMERFWAIHPGGIVCIVVPRQPLFEQWRNEVSKNFPYIGEEHYSYIGNGHNDQISSNTRVVIATQQTMILRASKKYGCGLLRDLVELGKQCFLVFDEAHHLGAKVTYERFVIHIPEDFYTLGLTATPMRRDGGMEEVYIHFHRKDSEGPIYAYPLANAVEDGVLCKVRQLNIKVYFNEDENEKHSTYGKHIRDAKQKIVSNRVIGIDASRIDQGDIRYLNKIEKELLQRQESRPPSYKQIWNLVGIIRKLKTLYIQRRRLFNKAEAKWVFLKQLLKNKEWRNRFTTGCWIFFHEEIEECLRTSELLKESFGEDAVGIHNSEIPIKEKERILEEFRDNKFSCLCAVKTLDEGIDVPDLNGIVIVSGSTSRRQQIQRCGRALRRAKSKEEAYLVSILSQLDNDLLGEKLLIGPNKASMNWSIEEISFN